MRALDLRPPGPVLIKPNLVSARESHLGIITRPEFVHGIVDYLIETGLPPGDIVIAEGSFDDLGPEWEKLGYAKIAAETGVRLFELNSDEPVPVSLRPGGPELTVARSVLPSSGYSIINVPKMRCHPMAVTTLSIKNMQGTIVPEAKRHLCSAWGHAHNQVALRRRDGETVSEEEAKALVEIGIEAFAQAICDVITAARPWLNIVEGIIGRDGTGFHDGRNYQTNLVVAGQDPVAVDAATSYLMGFDPADLIYLRVAAARGLGEARLSHISVVAARDGRVVPAALEEFRLQPPFRHASHRTA
jgi:uncharacterized protein (DUF362 family)